VSVVLVDLKKVGEKLTRFEESTAQISILIVTLIFYLLTKSPIFGVLVAVEFIAFVFIEIQQGVQHHGVRYEMYDTLKSLGIAVLLWLSVSVLLGTSVPISAVVSCSMLPNLQRGDLTIIRGATAASLNAPRIEMSPEDFAKVYSHETEVSSPLGTFLVNGSLFSYCQVYKYTDKVCADFYSSPSLFVEKRGPLYFHYSKCQRKVLGTDTAADTPCVTSLTYNGQEFKPDMKNDVIVYQPNTGDLFSYTGDIIHRTYLEIRAGNYTYVLTKGDNNDVLDIQFYDHTRNLANTPVQEKNIKGANVFAIPYVGYFKLFISGFVDEPLYCNTNLLY